MRKAVCCVALAFLLILTGCGNASGDKPIERAALSEEERVPLVQNLNTFSFGNVPPVLLGFIDNQEEGEYQNALYSPASMYIALAMLGECGDEGTKGEFTNMLQPAVPGELTKATGLLMDNMVFRDGAGFQTVDNEVLIRTDTSLDKTVRKLLAKEYRTTYGELPEDDPSIMVLINEINFRGEWVDAFEESRTAPGDFTLPDGTNRTAEYMNAFREDTYFIQSDRFSAGYYLFRDGSAMHFILPAEGVAPRDLLADGTALQTAVNYSGDNPYRLVGDVSYRIPKLTFDSDLNVTELMKVLYPSAINGSFPAIQNPTGPATVAKILQKCNFEMDEQGATAKAKTEISMESSEGEPSEALLLQLHLTRPFLFVITAPEGYITFVGVVNDPAA